MVEAINQGRCTACSEADDNYSVENKKMDTTETADDSTDGEDRILWLLRCTCGEKAAVAVTESGLQSDGPVSHEDASWNTDEEDDDE